MPAKRPQVGQLFEVYGVLGTIFRVWPFGTIDVETPDGRCWRVTGLNFV